MTAQLRGYQQRTINDLYEWFRQGNEGNPCLVLPTGAGKSHIVAALCKDALTQWENTRILMLTHVKELIEQNSQRMREHWKNAPMGIYSASIGRKDLGEPITFAGIQSVRSKANQLGHIDLCIIDECHLVSHKDEGSYRALLNDLREINPNMRIVGLTATPFRLGHGLITDKPALFDALLEPTSIDELIHHGHLAKLRSKVTDIKLDTSNVHKRGGEFIESELQAAVDTDRNNISIVEEVIQLAGDRKAWLFFCTGVDHAAHVKDELIRRGVPAECVTGDTPKKERERMIKDFKDGKLRALTNANVLTTGFDYPDIDLIAMLRPTMSPGLYIQMAGRGMRVKSHTDHCLVLDFAGVVERHGPITNVRKPARGGEGTGEAPVKVCDSCQEIVAISAKVCPECGTPFPEPKPKTAGLHLRDVDIMGGGDRNLAVRKWLWRKHISKSSGKEMLAVTYYGGLSDTPITEYAPVTHDGYAGIKARRMLMEIAQQSGANVNDAQDLDQLSTVLTTSEPPIEIKFKKEGKFYSVIDRRW